MFAGCLAKTADLNALKKAERMQGQGHNRAAIWDKTGWFRGVDDKWRFEISDDTMTVRFGEGIGVTGPRSRIQHKALAEAYPQLTDSWHAIQKWPDVQGFSDRMAFLNWGPDVQGFSDGTMFFVWGPDVQEAKSAAAHELQHAIQYLEGFAGGGTVSEFECLLPRGVRKSSARAQDALYEAYRRLAGEVEARNVEARVSYCPELRTVVPWLTQDVPSNLQLVSGVKQSDVATESLANVFMSLAVKRGRRSRRG